MWHMINEYQWYMTHDTWSDLLWYNLIQHSGIIATHRPTLQIKCNERPFFACLKPSSTLSLVARTWNLGGSLQGVGLEPEDSSNIVWKMFSIRWNLRAWSWVLLSEGLLFGSCWHSAWHKMSLLHSGNLSSYRFVLILLGVKKYYRKTMDINKQWHNRHRPYGKS